MAVEPPDWPEGGCGFGIALLVTSPAGVNGHLIKTMVKDFLSFLEMMLVGCFYDFWDDTRVKNCSVKMGLWKKRVLTNIFPFLDVLCLLLSKVWGFPVLSSSE